MIRFQAVLLAFLLILPLSAADKTAGAEKSASQLLEQAQALIGSYETAEPGDKQAEKDLAEAVSLLKTASGKGNAEAMLQLAMLYQRGIGVKADEAEAVRLLRLAAGKNNGTALMNLGFYYRMPQHRDDKLAAGCFCKALELNVPGAGVQFGALCHAGLGVERDPVRAAAAFRADALRGNAKAQNIYGVLLIKGDGVERDLKAGEAMLSKSAKQDYAPALCNLAILTRAQGGRNNLAEAERMFRRSAALGYVPALRNLAMMHMDKTGATDEDYRQAYAFASEAAGKGDAAALHLLGLMEWLGYGRNADAAKAFAFFLKSAQKGFPPACLQVADMYAKGEGIQADAKAAETWLKKAQEKFGDDSIQLSIPLPAAPQRSNEKK